MLHRNLKKTQPQAVTFSSENQQCSNLKSGNSMDEQLRQLIAEVCQHPDGSPEQRQAMDSLLRLIPNLPGLYKHYNQQINYQEVLNLALAGVSVYSRNVSGENINRFLQSRRLDINNADGAVLRQDFVKWFNRILNNKIGDQNRTLNQSLSLDVPINLEEGQTTFGDIQPDIRTLGDLDSWSDREEKERTRLKGYILELYIEQDPEGRLRDCYLNNCPDCNCQVLLREQYLNEQGEAVPLLADRFGIHKDNIYKHRQRKCKPLLQQISQDIENDFDEYVRRFIG